MKGQQPKVKYHEDLNMTDRKKCPLMATFTTSPSFSVQVEEYRYVRVATCQGKVREKQNFLQVRELSGNFEKMSGNFGHLTNVREMSGNFVMTIKFFQK